MVNAGKTPGYGSGSYSPAYQGRQGPTPGGYGGGASPALPYPAYAPYQGMSGTWAEEHLQVTIHDQLLGGAGAGGTPAYSYQPTARAGQGSAQTPAYNQARPTPGGGSNANNTQNGDIWWNLVTVKNECIDPFKYDEKHVK